MDADRTKRHELRKKLKLLKLSNMKMKKQLRLAMRVRFLNRMRLEKEISQLNIFLSNLKYNLIEKNTNITPKTERDLMNPESLQFQNENTIDCSDKNEKIDDNMSFICAIPVKKNTDEFKFFCDRCEFKSRKKAPFDIHMRRHVGEKPYKCNICQKGFVAKYELKLHKGKHSNKRTYNCDKCDYSTYRPDMLVNHTEKHCRLKAHICDFCGFKTEDRSNMIIHRKKHFPNEASSCTACKMAKNNIYTKRKLSDSHTQSNNMSASSNNLDLEYGVDDGNIPDSKSTEEVQHTCGKPWICDTCQTSFRKKESLTKHLRTHTGERPYKCDKCNYAAATRHTLVIHKRRHSGDKPYVCDQCSFRCTTKGYLKIHLNKHKGIKPFACDQCDYRSVDSCKLSAHRKVRHSGEKPFACEICPFRAKLRARLQQHIRIHGPRPYVCPHCARAFTLRRALQEHEGIHTGNQPFKCEVCKVEKRFTLEVTYRRHLARHRLKFSCSKCTYRTSLSKDLRRHMKVHLKSSYHPRKKSEKNLQCNICKYRCAQSTSLAKHIRSKHSESPQTAIAVQEINMSYQNNVPANIISSRAIPSSTSTVYSSNVSYSPYILNIPNSQNFQTDTNQETMPQQTLRNYTHQHLPVDYAIPMVSSHLPYSLKEVGNLVEMKSGNIQPLPNIIYSCDHCQFKGIDPHELILHKRIIHSKGADLSYSSGYYRTSM